MKCPKYELTSGTGDSLYWARDEDGSLTERDVEKIVHRVCNSLIESVFHIKICEIVDSMIEQRLKELIADMTEEDFDKFILEIRARRSLLPPKEYTKQEPREPVV